MGHPKGVGAALSQKPFLRPCALRKLKNSRSGAAYGAKMPGNARQSRAFHFWHFEKTYYTGE
ncbi:MAG TPA: hypothetical protein VFV17_03300 [Usitatibacteraceae bacterium]|nr:hypothetical protein [Usitatibacteraceae bacterium]